MKKFREIARQVVAESWSAGASSSNGAARADALNHEIKAAEHLRAAKRNETNSVPFHRHMEDYHRTMAKHVKASYHAGQWGHKADAKRDHDDHINSAKKHKAAALSVRSED